jgi:O-antigen/teichoic acid export membrane protein
MGIWLLVHTDLLSPFTAFLAMGVAALLTSFRQLVQLRPVLWPKQTSDLWDLSRRHWNYGRWAILSSLFIWIPWSVYYPLVARFSGLAEVANLRALLNLALPVTQAISALTLLFLPHVSDVGGQESWAGARSLALRITALFALGSVLYWLPICLFRASLIKFLYAGHYSQISPLIPWIGLSSVLSGAALGPTIAFRAMRSPSIVTFYYFVSSAVTLVIGIPGTRLFGLPGVVTCLLLSNFVAVVLGWTMLSRQAGAGFESRRVEQEAAVP